ncbi:hypothetical protein [Streptomyces sp. NPDC060205]|uniref:hypothetical protein n=1 Tax=Streptomyces sp. NPDC060205 TaxID=3347072 RepID=UPI00365A5E10
MTIPRARATTARPSAPHLFMRPTRHTAKRPVRLPARGGARPGIWAEHDTGATPAAHAVTVALAPDPAGSDPTASDPMGSDPTGSDPTGSGAEPVTASAGHGGGSVADRAECGRGTPGRRAPVRTSPPSAPAVRKEPAV